MPLTDEEVSAIRKLCYRKGSGKEEFKAAAGPVPNKAGWKSMFEAIDDRWEASRLTLKAQIDAALGYTTTADHARKIVRAWLEWKFRVGG